jgi:hypothetical protein
MMIAIVVVVITPTVAVPVMVMVPMVVVLKATAIPFPIAYKILATLMAWPNPTRSRVWRPRPITFVPLVVPPDRIPVTLDPYKFRPRSWREHANYPRGRRRPDADPNGNLSRRCDRAGQQEPGNQQDSAKRKRCKIRSSSIQTTNDIYQIKPPMSCTVTSKGNIHWRLIPEYRGNPACARNAKVLTRDKGAAVARRTGYTTASYSPSLILFQTNAGWNIRLAKFFKTLLQESHSHVSPAYRTILFLEHPRRISLGHESDRDARDFFH